MFNPITLIQSVWGWFTNTFSRLTSFTQLKFFLISLFLFGIGWYYIKCYETPIYQTGHEMRYFSCEPDDAPNVELHFRFNHNNLEGGITYCSCIVDSIAYLVGAATGHGRQGEGDVLYAADGELVRLIVTPAGMCACPVVEAGVVGDIDALQVVVVAGAGDIDVAVLVL